MKYEDIKTYDERCEKFQGIVTNERLMEVLIEEVEDLRAYVEQSLKPVAWIFTWYEIAKDRHVRRIIDFEERPNIPGYELIPLYTHPPQRKPLTNEELDALAIDEDGLPNSHFEFARAIEKAHGIGSEE